MAIYILFDVVPFICCLFKIILFFSYTFLNFSFYFFKHTIFTIILYSFLNIVLFAVSVGSQSCYLVFLCLITFYSSTYTFSRLRWLGEFCENMLRPGNGRFLHRGFAVESAMCLGWYHHDVLSGLRPL